MLKKFLLFFAVTLTSFYNYAQTAKTSNPNTDISISGWRLWPYTAAQWKNATPFRSKAYNFTTLKRRRVKHIL